LGQAYFRGRQIFRSQVVIIFVGVLIPMVGGILSLSGQFQIAGQRDLMPLAFALSNLVIAYGLARYQLFNLVPIARDLVIESLADAVFVLDETRRIIDANPAGYRLAGDSPLIGQTPGMLLPLFADFILRNSDRNSPVKQLITDNSISP